MPTTATATTTPHHGADEENSTSVLNEKKTSNANNAPTASKLPLSPTSSHQRRDVPNLTVGTVPPASPSNSSNRLNNLRNNNSLYSKGTSSSDTNSSEDDDDDNKFGIDDLSIQLSETARLERMMDKFDLITTSNSNGNGNGNEEEEEGIENAAAAAAAAAGEGEGEGEGEGGELNTQETPRALNDMVAKFDILQSSAIKKEYFRVVVRDDCNADEGEGIEITATTSSSGSGSGSDINLNSPTTCSTSSSMSVEQFRIGSSHTHDTIGNIGSGLSRTMSPSSPPMSPSSPPPPQQSSNNNMKLLEEHIITLMGQVSSLQTEKDVLHSQLRVQHTEDVQDMYHDPFSTGSPAKSGRAMASFNTSTFLSKINDAAAAAAGGTASSSTTATATSSTAAAVAVTTASTSSVTVQQPVVFDSNSDLFHRELTELRIRNQSLQNELDMSKQIQERLKINLKSVEKQDKQKFDYLSTLSKELNESTSREKSLRDELDACRVRLEGYEMVCGNNDDNNSGSDNSSVEGETGEEGGEKKKTKKKRKKKKKKNPSSPTRSSSMTNDVATALVVSTKQNDALVAHNTELELQNKKLNKQCNDLETKYGLIEPKGPDATNSAKQLYTRYIEMKSSLSSLAVVLEEVQEQNALLNKRIIQLETELSNANNNNDDGTDTQILQDDISSLTVLLEEVQEQNSVLNETIVQLEKELNNAQQQHDEEQKNVKSSPSDPTAADGAADSPVCSPRIVAPSFDEAITRTISKEQEETLQMLVNDLEIQITDYRDMEQRHEVVRVEFESSIDKLVEENADLKKALDVKLQQQSAAQQKQQLESELKQLRNELQNCIKELDSRLTVEKSTELRNALQSSRDAMDDASAESSELLNEMDGMLKSSQKELKNERIKFNQLEAKYKDLILDLTLKRDGDNDQDDSNVDRDDNDDEEQLSRFDGNASNKQLETLLSTTKKDFLAEQGKVEELNLTLTALHEEVNSLKTDLDKANSVAANRPEEMGNVEGLNVTILTLQNEIKQIKNELEQKSIKIVKSEERVTKKHERAKELAASNASLCEGIHALKGHLSTINDEAGKTEVMLGDTKTELNLEREKVEKLEVTNSSLRTELDVLKTCIDETTDKASTENIELTASLTASQKEFKMERKRREEISKEKIDLEALLDLTKEDLNTQKQNNTKLDAEISCLQKNVDSLTLAIAAATKKMETMDDAESKESTNLQDIVDSTNELLSVERAKVDELVTTKSSLQVELDSTKKNIEELSASTDTLKDEIEAVRRDASNDATETSLQFNELEKLLATTQEELNEEEKQVETLEGQVDDLTMQIQNHEKCQKDLQTSLDDVKEEIQTVRAKMSEFEELLTKKNQELGDLNTKLQNLESSKLEITKQSETVASDLVIATKEKSELISKVLGLECSNNETLEEVERLSNEKLEITKRSESLTIDLDNFSKENTELVSTVAALKEEKDSLTSLTESLQTEQKVLAEAYAAREAAAVQVVVAKEALSTENAELALTVTGLEFEKDNLMKSLKKKEEAIVELDSTREALSAEKKRANDMASQLNVASTDVRLWEAEMLLGSTKVKLEDALRTNHELSEKVRVLESSAEESQTSHELTLKVSESMYSETLKQYEGTKSKLESDTQMISSLESQLVSIREEKESLLKRTAALARRDQIQKGSLNTSNEEIGKLMTTIDNFQDRFQSLANQIQKVKAEKDDLVREHKQKEEMLIADVDAPQERLQKLQTEYDEIRAREADMKSKFVQTLTKHQSSWTEERDSLNKRITDLDQQRIDCQAELKACRDEIFNRDKTIAKVQGDALDKFVALQGSQQISKAALEREKELQLKYASCLQELETQQIKKVELRAVDIEKEKDLQSKHNSFVQDLKAQFKVTNDDKEELQTRLDSCLQEQEYFKSQFIITNDEKEELQSKHDSLERVLETIHKSKTDTIVGANNNNDISKKLEENKKALETIVDELNEARIREGVLEESLSSCKEELSTCKELIAKLNKSNDVLEMKNKNLTESYSKFDASKVILDRELQECRKERDSLIESARAYDEARDDDDNFKGVDAEKIKRENSMMKELLAKSQSAVSEAKKMQNVLSKEIESSSNREGHLKKEISMIRTQNEDMEKRLEDQEKELDEFETDFSMARDDARKVVEELRSQLLQLERRNQQLMADGTVGKVEELKNKLRQLIQQNKRLQKEIEYSKVREGRLESQLGLEPRGKKKGEV